MRTSSSASGGRLADGSFWVQPQAAQDPRAWPANPKGHNAIRRKDSLRSREAVVLGMTRLRDRSVGATFDTTGPAVTAWGPRM
jgi:hypothetical protein